MCGNIHIPGLPTLAWSPDVRLVLLVLQVPGVLVNICRVAFVNAFSVPQSSRGSHILLICVLNFTCATEENWREVEA